MAKLKLRKQQEPTTVDGVSIGTLIEEVETSGKLDKLDAEYYEPAESTLCTKCVWFSRPAWLLSGDSMCQVVEGRIEPWGSCRLYVDAGDVARYELEQSIRLIKAEDQPPRALPLQLRNAELTTGAWRAAREVAGMDARQLKRSALAFIGGDPESKSNYKLPYRDRRGRINVNAVRAIRAVLGGARGGVELPESIRPAVERNAERLWNWVQRQLEDQNKSWSGREVSIVKNEPTRRLVYGVVLEPETVDAHGDIVSKEEIERACHLWQRTAGVVMDQHSDPIDAEVVENYIAPATFTVNDRTIKEGSWIQVTKIYDDEIWKAVLSGEKTGYSFGGWAVREPEEGQ